jgi:sensor histidine kinase YesM
MAKKCFQDIAGFDDRLLILVGWPLASMLISLMLFGDSCARGDWQFLAVCVPMSFMYTGVFWFALRWAYKKVKDHYPTFQDIGKRLMWVSLAFLVVFFLVDYALDEIFDWLIPGKDKVHPSYLQEFISSLIMSALVMALYEAISFYVQLQRTVAEKAELERQNIESQLEGLRNQVNPHFLFNSLNTLIYLIPEDSEKAVRFVQQLSKVYRYVLESRDSKLIPLSEELEFLKSYIFLLKERFGENLQVDIRPFTGRQEIAIVPLTLQMLFENAIKHNVVSTGKPLHIEVFGENGHLVVRNNLQKKNQVMDSTGVGLQNIKDRYRMLTDKAVEVITSQQYFTVLLPAIEVREA